MLKSFLSWFILYFITLLCPLSSFAQGAEGHSRPDRFAGVGISVDLDSARRLPYVVEVLSGMPGAMAGLRSGDYILAIGRWKTLNKNKARIVRKLRGRAGSSVVLTIAREGKKEKFSIRRQKIVIKPQPLNFCEALDKMIRAGADSFKELKGKMISEPVQPHQPPNFEWLSALTLSGFGTCSIVKKYDTGPYFYAVYFTGNDSVQATHLFDKLVGNVRDCLPYTCTDSYQETNYSDMTGFSTSFVLSQVKKEVPADIRGSVIKIQYIHLRNEPVKVILLFSLKP